MLTRKSLGALKILGSKYDLAKANLLETKGFWGEIFSFPEFKDGWIDIDENLPGESVEYRQTLLHEVIHALSTLQGLNLSEEQTELLGIGLERAISDNPSHFAMSAFPNVTQIVTLWKEGYSLREVGVKVGKGKDSVRNTLNKLGYDTKHPYVETVERQSVLTGETDRQTDKTDGKTQTGVKKLSLPGGFVTILGIILLVFIGWGLINWWRNRTRQTEIDSQPKIKKTFGFGNRSIEELDEARGFDLPGEDIPDEF